MSPRKSIVEKYIEGFNRSDHAQILSCLADDVVWALHGYRTLEGKEALMPRSKTSTWTRRRRRARPSGAKEQAPAPEGP